MRVGADQVNYQSSFEMVYRLNVTIEPPFAALVWALLEDVWASSTPVQRILSNFFGNHRLIPWIWILVQKLDLMEFSTYTDKPLHSISRRCWQVNHLDVTSIIDEDSMWQMSAQDTCSKEAFTISTVYISWLYSIEAQFPCRKVLSPPRSDMQWCQGHEYVLNDWIRSTRWRFIARPCLHWRSLRAENSMTQLGLYTTFAWHVPFLRRSHERWLCYQIAWLLLTSAASLALEVHHFTIHLDGVLPRNMQKSWKARIRSQLPCIVGSE